jgi:adenine C2-methylase RlmN of 23S rRNA A2503 and tRNA A37
MIVLTPLPGLSRGSVMGAVRRLQGDLGIGARHITLSTVGLVPRIRKLADMGACHWEPLDAQ